MGVDLSNYEDDVCDAARLKQQESGTSDQGERSGVTAGKNMDGFVNLVEKVVHSNGLPNAQIHLQCRVLTLPGYFRPTKRWDMLVTYRSHLVTALEFKSQVGPSFGNNVNNRTEEALGTSVDFWKAFREGGFGDSPAPFTGWMIFVEDVLGSRSPVKDKSPHFLIFPEFQGASYADRYNILCRKLVQEQLYTAASVLVSPRTAADSGDHIELSEFIGFRRFVRQLSGHVAAEAG